MIECALLNRLRGTGALKHFSTLRVDEMKIWKLTIPKIEIEVTLVWNHIYGMYLALVFGLLAMNVWAGLAVLVAYLVGESKGWGEWVGALTSSKELTQDDLLRNYKDNEGRGFPYIHKIANLIAPEKGQCEDLKDNIEQYIRYARVALTLRGIFWWGLVYGVIFAFGLISVYEYILITLALGFGFPIACFIGKKLNYNGKFSIIHFSQGWENQELVYGFMQGITLWYVILGHTYG